MSDHVTHLCSPYLRSTLSLLSVLTLAFGCRSEVKPVEFPELVITPNPIIMERPAVGEALSEVTVTISNPAWFESVVTEVSIVNASGDGLSIANESQWSSAVVIPPEESKSVTLRWTVSGPTQVTAQLKVVADDAEYLVPVETETPYPEIRLSSNPNGRTTETGLEIHLIEAAPGDWERAEVYIEGGSGSPLTITSVCLSDLNGDCLSANETESFKLCGDAGANPNLCPAIGDLPPLAYGERHTLSVLFTPPTGTRQRSEARLSIQSDAATLPEATVLIQGSPCVRSAPGEACSPVYSIEHPQLSQGRQVMESDGYKLEGQLSVGAHLSYDSKSGLFLSGSLSP